MRKMNWKWSGLALAALMLLAAACAPAAAPAPTAAPAKPAEAAKPAAAASPAEAAKPAQAGRASLISVVPNAPPRATPTPLPAGAAPPPQPVPPAAKIMPLYAHIDTVTAGSGESKFNVDANLGCAKSGVFSRGMHIVWRMEVVDTSTGKILQGEDIDNAVVKLPHGEEVKMRFGRHGSTAESPWFWTAAWDVPMDYPLGALNYSVTVAAKGGKSMTFVDPLVMTSGTSDTRVTIVPVTGAT